MKSTISNTWKRVIGIVGGLGPYAHVELERLILEATRVRLDRPLRDQDYPEWIVSSIPGTPDRTEAVLGEAPSPVPWLEESLRRLAGNASTRGADFAVIACNTAHLHLPELRSTSPIPILDMVSETISEAGQATRTGTIGLLATTGTLRTDLYGAAAARIDRSLRVISLLDCRERRKDSEQLQEDLVMEPIYGPLREGCRAGGGIKSGPLTEHEWMALRRPLIQAVDVLGKAGAELVILGCTEIPLALGRSSVNNTPLVDPLQVAASAAVEIALGIRPLP
jgi:aspartate racemase